MLGLTLAIALLVQVPSEPTVTLIFRDHVEIAKPNDLEAWYKYCTRGQVDAGLCLPNACITWEQHVAEVTSWWAAPKRVYVRCDDPRVRPPTQKR